MLLHIAVLSCTPCTPRHTIYRYPLTFPRRFVSSLAREMSVRKDTASALVLVTGCSGYVASHIVLHLLESGYRVRGSVRESERGEGAALVARHARSQEQRSCFEEVVCDLLKDEGWEEAMRGVDFVLHVASPVLFAGSVDNELDAVFKPALAGTRRVMLAAAAAGSVRRVVYTSSVSAALQSMDRETPFDETSFTDPWDTRFMAYNRSKSFAELTAWLFATRCPMSREKLRAMLTAPTTQGRRPTTTTTMHAMAIDAWLAEEIQHIERVFDETASASKSDRGHDADIQQRPQLQRLAVCVICPAYIIGPVLLQRHVGRPGSSSSELIRSVMTSRPMQFAQPPLALPVVDVRDVARIQLVALEHESEGVVGQRFIAGAGNLSFTDTASYISKHFGSRGYNPVPRKLPRGVAHIVASLLADRTAVDHLDALGKNVAIFRNDKAMALLHTDTRITHNSFHSEIGFRSLEESVVDTASSLIALGLVTPPKRPLITALHHLLRRIRHGYRLLHPALMLLIVISISIAIRGFFFSADHVAQ